jgi:hypothetical protein
MLSRRPWWLLPLVLCAVLYAPTLTTGFLADDYTYLVSLGWWAENGEIAARVARNFVAGIEAESNYYRPITILTFALNFVAGGAEPFGWRLVNVVAHLVCGVLVAAIALRIADRNDARAAIGAAIAAGVFVLSPLSTEIGAWVSGRFDALATLFMLAALACFGRAQRWNDGWGIVALAAGVLAFATKESATLLPVYVVALALARPREEDDRATGAIATIVTAFRRALPWFVLLAVYLAWRTVLFGSPLRVYPGAAPVSALIGGGIVATLASAGPWLAQVLPQAGARLALGISLAIALALGGAWCLTRHGERLRWLALAGAVVVSVLLPLLQVRALDDAGEGGRLFYVAAAGLALLVALPWLSRADGPPWLWNRMLRSVFVVASLAVLVAEAILLHAALVPWRDAGRQSRELVREIAALAPKIPADGYGFVLVPDRIGYVPFGRLAPGGFTLPPVQREALLSRLIVQSEPDLPSWPDNIHRGLVDALKRFPPREVWAAVGAGRGVPDVAPTHFYCWDTDAARLVSLPLAPPFTPERWLPAWREALQKSSCTVLARRVAGG